MASDGKQEPGRDSQTQQELTARGTKLRHEVQTQNKDSSTQNMSKQNPYKPLRPRADQSIGIQIQVVHSKLNTDRHRQRHQKRKRSLREVPKSGRNRESKQPKAHPREHDEQEGFSEEQAAQASRLKHFPHED
jgi:hypothetical protein